MIDNTIVEEALKRVDKLAEKLGTSAEYLWPKLVSYEYMKGIGALLFLFLGWSIGLTILGYFIKNDSKDKKEETLIILSATFVIVGILSLVITIVGGPNIIAQVFSPEAAAFYNLIGK